MSPLLEVERLAVAIGGHEAVCGLSYRLQAGETLGMVGESGCGKTLAALALLGLLPEGMRARGSARFAGRELLVLDEAALRRIRGGEIGMIFQEPMSALNPVVTIGEQIAEVYRLHYGTDRRRARDRAAEALHQVHIVDASACLCHYPHQLSGGQRQRVMIAMALACRPRLLIADEPTTALDVTVQAQILALIQELKRETEMAVLFISHNLGVIAQIADRILVMYAGREVESAPAGQLLDAPRHPYTRALLATLPRIGECRHPLPTIAGRVPALHETVAGCRFSNRCPLADDGCRAAEPPLREERLEHHVACYKSAQVVDAPERVGHA
ncbi:MAG: ABC transporter ATP-binding protein [Candidatus Competibacterales bacterium]|nr:ABC transporter ATP-binding protein [Candidatus Competibacterales bacterium]